jgi:hypothetical protein
MNHPKDNLPPEDEWSRISPSKEWLYATSEFSGPHKAECDHVLGWVKGEEACRATLCEHGRDLAAEWIKRCTAFEETAIVDSARKVQADLAARAGEAATDCGTRLEAIVRDGCGSAASCLTTGQRWATRCAKSEGTPLTLRILQKAIERRQEQGAEPVQLDPRTCDDIQKDVLEAAKCKDRFVCQEAIPRVELYRERCESDGERPTIVTAVAELTVLVGGGKPPEAVVTRSGSPALGLADAPVSLADGSGGVIYMCEERASDMARYLGSRKSCQGGKMVVARAFPTSRGVEVHAGALDFPDDASFSARYPTVVAFGELDHRDKEAAAGLAADLDKAAGLARSGSAVEAVRLVTKAVATHALSIRRSRVAKEALTRHDDALVPVLKEIAKAKLAAGKGFKVAPTDAVGLFARAQTRAFADLSPEGSVQISAPGRGFSFDTASLLPHAMEAYLGVLKAARPPKLNAKAVAAEKSRGLAAAQACGGAEKKLQDSKKSLVSCNFGLEACDEAKHAALAKAVDEARLSAETAFHELDAARSAAGDEGSAITHAADSAGCREPWW